MSYVLSPNMGLPVPVVGSEAGPQFAIDINNCMSTLDAHTHAAGSGVQITPAAININTALSLNNNSLTSVAGVVLQAQGSTPANNTVYESGTDLYFVDGVGNNVRITQSGGIAGSPGSISNLTSPASAAYVAASKTFVWQSGSSIAANMDAASILMRNITPNSTNALTLQPPASLAANYSLTLPALPGSTSFLTLDTSGNISGSISTNAGIIGSNIALATISRANLTSPGVVTSAPSNFSTSTGTSVNTGNGVAISTSGNPILILVNGGFFATRASSGFSGYLVSIGLNGSVYATLSTPEWFDSIGSSFSGGNPGSIILPLAAGTYTFSIFLSSSSTSVTAAMSGGYMTAYELK